MDEVNAAPQSSLAAIVFTDIVGFSRMMSENEALALPRAKAELARLRDLCQRHHGNVLKNTGDGLLMHFTSAVQAVACALEIQKTIGGNEGQVPLQHRIGIHLGDVTLEDGDVMGDGVNIAARLQTQADPGGICISKTVYDVVKNRLAIQATFLGPRELKNIREAVPIYKILLEAQTGAPLRSDQLGRRSDWIIPVVVVVLLLVVLAVGMALYKSKHPRTAGTAPPASATAPAAAPPAVASPAPLSHEAHRFIGAWLTPQRRTVMVFLPDGRYGVDLTLGDRRILGLVGTWQADANSITTVRTDPDKTSIVHLLSVTDSQLIGQSDTGFHYFERIPMPNLPTVTISGISPSAAKDPSRPQLTFSNLTFPAAQSYNLGVTAFNSGDYEQAISRFTEALALKPDFDLALFRRAEAHDLNNAFDRSLADYTQLIKAKPRDVAALNNRAGINLKLGKYQAALDDANSALTIKPDFLNALGNRGRAYLLLGQYAQAITDFDAALAINARNIATLIDRGVAKKASGDLVGGQADLDQAAALQAAPQQTANPPPAVKKVESPAGSPNP